MNHYQQLAWQTLAGRSDALGLRAIAELIHRQIAAQQAQTQLQEDQEMLTDNLLELFLLLTVAQQEF
jgi:hypothetical protein